jgi:hypothetical protein
VTNWLQGRITEGWTVGDTQSTDTAAESIGSCTDSLYSTSLPHLPLPYPVPTVGTAGKPKLEEDGDGDDPCHYNIDISELSVEIKHHLAACIVLCQRRSRANLEGTLFRVEREQQPASGRLPRESGANASLPSLRAYCQQPRRLSR